MKSTGGVVARRSLSRVFIIENTAGPANQPTYMTVVRAGAPSKNYGDVTPIRVPDPNRYGSFIDVGEVRGEQRRGTLPLMGRYSINQLSKLMQLADRGCKIDVQLNLGLCKDPRDNNRGWDKKLIYEAALIQTHGIEQLGALDSGEDAAVDESVEVSVEKRYEVMPLNFKEMAASLVDREVIDVAICDAISCGECGTPSNGCDKVFAVTRGSSGSPGLLSELVYSNDGGTTWAEMVITTLAASENPSALACVGAYVVVISVDSCSHHYALRDEIIDGATTWTEITGGYSATRCPRAIVVASPQDVFIAANNGYIYKMTDPTAAVTVVHPGDLTANDLMAIHTYDDQNILAVGEDNTVLRSTDGGSTWELITGPAGGGVNLTACWMRGDTEWFVGTGSGRLYYTNNAGQTWTEKSFPGSAAGVVRDISFATRSVGYLAHSTATPAGRVLRTIDGGYSWYVMPEGTGSIPANDYVGALAACEEDPNVVFGAGMADNATDGFLVKAST